MENKTIAVWPTKMMKVSELVPHERNPRQISQDRFELLKAAIEEEGFRTPPTVDENGILLAGHQRFRAMLDLGFGEVEIPVSVPPEGLKVDERMRRRILARDNISWGDFDREILFNDYDAEELLDLGFDEAFLGISDDDLEPADEGEQGRLDEKHMTECPNCGEVFDHADHQAKNKD